MNDIERMVVSAHEDGEVESPWKEKVESRMSDPVWAAEADLHRRVKAALVASPEPDWTEVGRRVKARLEADPLGRPTPRVLPMAWLSVAAAALLVLAAGGGFWLGRQTIPASGPADVAELQVQVPKALGLQLSGEGQLLMASTLQGNRR